MVARFAQLAKLVQMAKLVWFSQLFKLLKVLHRYLVILLSSEIKQQEVWKIILSCMWGVVWKMTTDT